MTQGRVLVAPLAAIVLAVLTAAGAAFFMSTRSAYAEISGPCIATIAGVDVAGVDSGNRDDDIHVSKNTSVTVGAASPVGFQSHKIQLELGSRKWTVSEEDDNGSPSWSGTVNVDDYATWGVGLYKVIGVSTLSDGTTCTGAATVDVGGNPLTTVVGGIAAGAAVVGTVGAVASGAMAATRRPGPLSEFGPEGELTGEVWQEHEASREQPEPEQEEWTEEDERREVERIGENEKLLKDTVEATGNIAQVLLVSVTKAGGKSLACACFAALALIMTPLMALTGGGAGGTSSGPTEPARPAGAGGEKRRRLPRPPWLPRITLLGLLSGLLAGAGAVVLLQQYSIEYPTLAAIIRNVLIGMAVYGIVLPTLGYTIGWLRVNRRIAARERELGWR